MGISPTAAAGGASLPNALRLISGGGAGPGGPGLSDVAVRCVGGRFGVAGGSTSSPLEEVSQECSQQGDNRINRDEQRWDDGAPVGGALGLDDDGDGLGGSGLDHDGGRHDGDDEFVMMVVMLRCRGASECDGG